jgi:hypothetical protein
MDIVNYLVNVVMNFLTKGRLYGVLLLSKETKQAIYI